jgi:hypothetical protein
MKFVTKFASTVLPIAAAAATAWAVGVATPAAAATHYAKATAYHAGGPLYDAAPQGRAFINSDDPSLTGGGSVGYNQNIYNW